jgi:hypothetical protein
MKTLFCIILLLLAYTATFSQNTKRWSFSDDSGIYWNVKPHSAHSDHIEMSGLQISAIVQYGVSENGILQVNKKLVFPMLRTIPNNTHASLIVDFNQNNQLQIVVNGDSLQEYPKKFSLRGKLTVNNTTNTELETTRTLFPSIDKPAFIEIIKLKNKGKSLISVEIKNNSTPIETDPAKGVYGKYIVAMDTKDIGVHKIAANEEFTFSAVYSARKQHDEIYSYSGDFELKKRDNFVEGIFSNLILDTPNDTINRAFSFAKLRATESIYDTKGGLMHGPGGGAYYAAIWANDQAEYANPFFPFMGNINGNESAINSYRHFARFMNPDYKPIPSSIVAEGVDIWNGAGDRGDQAMIAYGASRYALATGRKEIAKELWPLISWCLEYLERKKTADGVIASDNDELEGRFPAGKVNLSTNSLTYGAYLSAACLADEFKLPDMATSYRTKAQALRVAIEKYFGANVQGFKTYKYHADNDKLRAWICIPLVMGITERKEQTIKALFSPYLWTSNGILTQSGSTTFWDRSTLYAFRGLFANGATDKAMKYFSYYSAMRLLGEHVPYPVEAWPEGGQRHLSAESALYCRTVTEGLFGINPTGLNKFTITPTLPNGWNYMKLKNIKAFDRTFDIEIQTDGNTENVIIKMSNGALIKKKWDRKTLLEIVLP